VVLLGTGTPVPDPDRSGPATAIVVGDSAYLVDFGPGVVRRAEAAVLDRGITQLEPGNLKVAFVTHLHSDHTAGYSDLILTGWTSGRSTPLEVYGPAGLRSMTEHILQAYRIDIETLTNPEGNQRACYSRWLERERPRNQARGAAQTCVPIQHPRPPHRYRRRNHTN